MENVETKYIDLKNNYKVLREIIEKNFPLNELVPEYDGLTHNTANVFCVFHKNVSSPSGKLYWDDERDILVLHCFAEHKTFTAFDYVNLVLCDRKKQYDDPLDFLTHNMPADELNEYIKLAYDKMELLTDTAFEKRIEYITNLYNEHDNVADFINQLYSA